MGHHCSINRVQACLGSRGQLKGGICNDYEPNAVFFHGLPLPQYYEGGKDPNDLSAGTLRPPLRTGGGGGSEAAGAHLQGVSPTEEGARLLAHVEAVLGRYRLLQNDLPAIAQGRSTVRVGFRPYSGEAEMIQLCRDFQQCFPETRVVFNEMRNVTPSLFLDEDQFDFLATTMRLLPPDWQEKYGYCVLGEMEEVQALLSCHESAGQAGRDRAGGAGPAVPSPFGTGTGRYWNGSGRRWTAGAVY